MPPWYKTPWFLIGISDIFNAVAYTDLIPDAGVKKQAQALEYHFRRVPGRLAHSLDVFQRNVFELEASFNNSLGPLADLYIGQALDVKAGIAAESVMSYINMFVDDVGRLIPFVFDVGRVRPIETFGELRNLITEGHYPAVKPLFKELDVSNSWWKLALKRGIGARQRLVHYTDVIDFTGVKGDGEEEYRIQCTIWDPITGGQRIDFIKNLRSILEGLCDWLDRLEQVLGAHVTSRARTSGTIWHPSPVCPRALVPIELPLGTRDIPEDFMYLPLCNGSLSSRCRFSVTRQVSTGLS
jgi:hypothetical protein